VAALAACDSLNLIRHSELATALTLESLLGVSDAFDERIHAARRHLGQAEVAAHVRLLLAGSSLIDAEGRVQDAYSLRCAPQVLGPALDTLRFVEGWIENEINAATDNPLIFAGPDGSMRALSGGNFHGEVMGLAMDFLSVALAEVGALMERQINRMVNGNYSQGLPPMLVSTVFALPGLTSAAITLPGTTW